MEEANRCPQCGIEVEQDGTCPACLLKLGLSGAIPATPEAAPSPAPVRRRWKLDWRWVAAPVAVIAIVLVVTMLWPEPQPVRGPVVRFNITPPDEASIQDFALSPDGRLAFTASSYDGRTKLWWRGLDTPRSQEVPGTEGAAAPFWSPDSRWIGFFAAGKLKRVDLAGGPPMPLADAPLPHGGSWSPQGVILFAGRGDGVLRVAASGGEVTQVTKGKDGGLRWPFFLPDGVNFLSFGSVVDKGIYVSRLDSGEIHKVSDGGAAIFSEGRLIYTRGGTLLSQPFDTNRMELSGEPVPIHFAEAVRAGGARPPAFSAGAGVLAYRNGDAPTQETLMWLDRQGRVLGNASDPAEGSDFALSPDNRQVAFTRTSQGAAADLWVRDLARATSIRLTFDGPGAASPKWSPDGRKIAYVASRGQTSIQAARPDGSGNPEMLLQLPQAVTLNDWSPDGRFLIYTSRDRDGKQALWTLPMEGDHKPTAVLQGRFHFKQARFSPDGRWLAYVSDEAGRDDVYVQSFPPGNGKWMVSNEGGAHPVWRRDGRELFYLQASRHVMSTVIRVGTVLETSAPQPLLEIQGSEFFEVTQDGQRFLVSMSLREERPEPIQIVLNWAAELLP